MLLCSVSVVASLSVVAACGVTHPSAARQATEQRFVSDVQETATDIGPYATSGQLIKLGYAACDAFRAKANNEQVAGMLENTGPRNLPPEDLGAVIAVAVRDLCPAYAGRLNPVQGG
jgi:hypothetical protein